MSDIDFMQLELKQSLMYCEAVCCLNVNYKYVNMLMQVGVVEFKAWGVCIS